jgi:hypothetical protein
MSETAFIVGSPRSGTTLLGDILDLHPQIGRWYEPYFVLDRYFRDAPNDCLRGEDATPEVTRYLRREFERYRRKRGCQIVVDKSPRNSLKIPFLRKVFPDAKFIHMLRDGRDVALSINREWRKRKEILEQGTDLQQMIRTVNAFLGRQPLMRHKIAAAWFEMGGLRNFLGGRGFLHRARWNGRVGWGPRFEGWQDLFDEVSMLEFNAMQWARCVEAVVEQQKGTTDETFMESRYEDLLREPRETLQRIFDFLDVSFPEQYMSQLPQLNRSNTNKWRDAFSEADKALIAPVLDPLLTQLGYADGAWYTCQG